MSALSRSHDPFLLSLLIANVLENTHHPSWFNESSKLIERTIEDLKTLELFLLFFRIEKYFSFLAEFLQSEPTVSLIDKTDYRLPLSISRK